MKLKNNSGKIVCVGDVNILPGKTEVVSDDFAQNIVVDRLVEMKKLSIVKEKPVAPKTAPAPKKETEAKPEKAAEVKAPEKAEAAEGEKKE